VRNGVLLASGAFVLSGVGLWLGAWRRLKRVDTDCRETEAGRCTPDEATRRFQDAHIQPFSRAGVALVSAGGASLALSVTLTLFKRRERRPLSVVVAAQHICLQQTF
jgi:anti-sigma-K factor RskA